MKFKYVVIDIRMRKTSSPVQKTYDAKRFLTNVTKSHEVRHAPNYAKTLMLTSTTINHMAKDCGIP